MKTYLLLPALLLFFLTSCQNKRGQSTHSFRYDDFSFLDSLQRNKLPYFWKNIKGIIDSSYLKDSVQSTVDGIDSFTSPTGKIYAARTESRPPEANYHTTGALCLICFFKSDDKGQKHFVNSEILSDESPLTFGSWGTFPPTKLISIGKQQYAYQVNPGFTGQGETLTNILLYQITDSLHIRKILSIEPADDDNSGICDDGDTSVAKCFSYATTLNIQESDGTFYKLKAIKKGTNLIDDKIVNIDSTLYYEYRNKRYEMTKTEVK